MADRPTVTTDGNEASSRVAYLTNEVVSIYPITPASPMGENSDSWAAQDKPNIWGSVPDVIEMQSEAGAAGACHGSLQAGALTTTFTASQGLLLMIPNMFKIAGELTPSVFHISARCVATHALSIFAEHSDVMACRGTGWAMLASGSVQESQDMAMIAQMATLESRVPFLHFFDGFRTSHEINKIQLLTEEEVRALTDEELVRAHRARAMNPDNPIIRGTAQNPDVFFQARESCNPFYLRCAGITQKMMDRFFEQTGRRYNLFDYVGHPEAERVAVIMASGFGAGEEAINKMVAEGEKVGMLKVRLYRPFDVKGLVRALPKSAKQLTVLDRTKEPGSIGEPLYTDVVTALSEGWEEVHGCALPKVYGGRYGISSKEFTPAMFKGALDDLKKDSPKKHYVVGIEDDVTHLSIDYDPDWSTEPDEVTRAVFWGLGSDGTVGASKNSVKIIAESTPMFAQGYFVYDSKKAGSVTVSHLRFGPKEINSTYLISRANFVGCNQFNFLERMDVLAMAEPGATFLLNSPYTADEVWDKIPAETQQAIIDKKLEFYVIDGAKVAEQAGLGNRINTVMQAAFFKLSGILPEDEAIAKIKDAIEKSYSKRGRTVVERNFAAVDGGVSQVKQVAVPASATSEIKRVSFAVEGAPEYVQNVTSVMIAGRGDDLPVSAFAPDGTFLVGTTKYEKRSVAREVPIWDPDTCIDCAVCSLACPHAAIRMKVFTEKDLAGAPEGFKYKKWRGKDRPEGTLMTIQLAPDDCTGCGVCVDVCLGKNKQVAKRRAINMEYKLDHLENERKWWTFFDEKLPNVDRTEVRMDDMKSNQLLETTFEFSGACAGCGETPYVKLISQLFGERMLIANATGCSSIYGGNLPTTPFTTTQAGRGPTWNNSLFEDNAEFGLGMRLAIDAQRTQAEKFLKALASELGEKLVDEIISAEQKNEADYKAQWERVEQLKSKLEGKDSIEAKGLLACADSLVERSVWIVGGDGWAYDIGFGGLDHVLASGRNVNCLVLDTEVYSNTGGQASKATPRGAVAKFAASGKPITKKDLGMIAMAYGNVYVAQIAMGANQRQTIKAMLEAEAYPGPSLIIAYSTCIAHGIDMTYSQSHMKNAVKSGFWPLYRFTPHHETEGAPFHLDCRKPTMPFKEYAMMEGRFAMLARSKPAEAEKLFDLAQQDINERWRLYEQMAGVERAVPQTAAATEEV
jgi:pyruvate-ferredoxin/flavodoxin oxidoreductase